MRPTVADMQDYLNQVDTTPATVAMLAAILDRAYTQVLVSLQARMSDPRLTFDDNPPTPSTRIVLTYGGSSIHLPVHVAGSVTLVEAQSSSNPTTWTGILDEWEEESDGALYRAYGWGLGIATPVVRYRITAQWGYGAMPSALAQIVLAVAVNIWRSKETGGFVESIGTEGQGALRSVAGLNTSDQKILHAWCDVYRDVAI